MSNPYRKRYTVTDDGRFVEKRIAQAEKAGITIISDITPFVTQEGEAITSRAALREYERKNGVRQVGNDWTGSEKPSWWDATINSLNEREQRR
jgi:hypothetical protein